MRQYQGLDRTYQVVYSLLRGQRSQEDLSDDQAELVRTIVVSLDRLIRRWRTPEAALFYRGLRDAGHVLANTPESRQVLTSRSFLSTTIFRDVAVREFTQPAGAGGAALLEIQIPEGTPALWVPPLGDPALAYQGELILPRGTELVVRSPHEEARILVIECEVVP